MLGYAVFINYLKDIYIHRISDFGFAAHALKTVRIAAFGCKLNWLQHLPACASQWQAGGLVPACQDPALAGTQEI